MRIAIIFDAVAGTAKRRSVQSLVLVMDRGQFGQGYADTILNCEQKVAVRLGVVWFQFQCLPRTRQAPASSFSCSLRTLPRLLCAPAYSGFRCSACR